MASLTRIDWRGNVAIRMKGFRQSPLLETFVTTDPRSTTPLLVLEGATKNFGPVKALRDGTIKLFAGETHALVGENGAGKSTLVKILAGAHEPDSGQLIIEGLLATVDSPAAARAAGIAVIYQEPTLFPDLTIAENIFVGRQPIRPARRIDRNAMNKATTDLFTKLGVQLDPERPARGLSVADQQLVEIAKALSLNAQVLIMDEPTAALSGVEVDRLFEVMRMLCGRGAAVLFISHRLEEVFEISQRVTIMRDGRVVSTAPIQELTVDEIIRAMVGRDLAALFPRTKATPGDVLLEVEHLGREGVLEDINFTVRRGEIVALAGLVGSGRSEVARAVFGIDQRTSGVVRLAGKVLPNGRPLAAMSAGMALVPEDRRHQGLVMELDIGQNIALASLRRLRRYGLISRTAQRSLASWWASQLKLKFGDLKNSAATLSGGNQQKAVLGKWLARHPSLLIIDEPTRGIDIGAKSEVHRILDSLVADGLAVLIISSELPEIIGMADRILVLREGRLVAELSGTEATANSVMRAATGQAAAA